MPVSGSRNIVISIVGENENGILLSASEWHKSIFSQFGYEHCLVNMLDQQSASQLPGLLKSGKVAFACGLAGVGSRFQTGSGVNLWEAYKIPFVSLWYDHPAHNYPQHIVKSSYILNYYYVEDHFLAWKDFLPHNSAATYSPGPLCLNPFSRDIPWPLRKKAFMFAKTGKNPVAISAAWEEYPKMLRDMLCGLAEQAKVDRNINLCAATADMFGKIGKSTEDLDSFMGVVQEVDLYIRAWRSDAFVRSISGFPAHVYGDGWEYLEGFSKHVKFFPAFSGAKLLHKIIEYRLVANTNPLWRDGIHERVNVGIAGGAVVLTDNTNRSKDIFGGLPNYVGFEWGADIREAAAKAWDKAGDDVDYVEESIACVSKYTHTAGNFMQPLENAIARLG